MRASQSLWTAQQGWTGKSEGKADFEFAVKEAGAYRLEAWLKLDDEWRPWIFANPIYVK